MEKIKTIFRKDKIFSVILISFLCFIGIIFFISSVLIKNGNSINIISLIKPEIVEAKIIKTKVVPIKSKIVFGLPIKLKIPTLKINSNIESIGLTKDGAVDSPVGPINTGWYKLGPRPGEIGSAIIDGHSGWKGGIPAVFDNLYKIKIGDKIYVEDDKGKTIAFVVRKIMKYDPNVIATDVFISTDKKSHLNLITCTGVWDNVSKSHSSRLIVFTDKE